MLDPSGKDIVFVVGAPGSKWSAVAHALMYASGINRSDISPTRSNPGAGTALHFGNYFGPGMEYGTQFASLDVMTKEELLSEFAAPYSTEGGIKLLKSHIFSRHLPRLKEMFPHARFLLVYRPDEDCLEWWKAVGGFDIGYPDYSWYENTQRMSEQIALDNLCIAEFAAQHSARLVKRRSMSPILTALGLSYNADEIRVVADTEFERRWGLGNRSTEKVLETCHSLARRALTCVI